MVLRRLFVWTTVAFLLFGPRSIEARSAAEDIDKPRIIVGDEWLFIDQRDSSEILLKVISKRWDIYIFEELTKGGGRQLNYDSELNQVGGDKKLDFPLRIGKKWSWQKWIADTVTLVEANFEVLAKEKRRVPAGTFEALRIQAVMDAYFLGFHAWRGTVVYWYAECAGSVIEVMPDFERDEIIPRVLKSYKFQNAPSGCV